MSAPFPRHQRRPDSSQFRKLKLALADQLRRDTDISVSARLVGLEMISRAWEDGGGTDAQAWFCTVLGLSLRTVVVAIKELCRRGYFRVEKAKGRSNRYFLVVQKLHRYASSHFGAAEDDAASAKNNIDVCRKLQGGCAEKAPLIPSDHLNPLTNDRDPDGDDVRATKTKLRLAENLAMEIAQAAGLPMDRVWPLHWQNADKIVARWLSKGWTSNEILTGVALTMKRKPTAGHPLSIEYFEKEISKVVAKRMGDLSATEEQRFQNQIAAEIGWAVIVELAPDELKTIVLRLSKGEIGKEDLHRLKMELEARSASRRVAGV